MLKISNIHHIAIIASNYEASKHFYTQILGFGILAENYREERRSYKLDLTLNGNYVIELFSFPDPPARPSRPEAAGLRHLAFSVPNIEAAIAWMEQHNVPCEPIRTDPITGKRFTFFADPDGLPLEFYEVAPPRIKSIRVA
jgi:glyoxylase I family protein